MLQAEGGDWTSTELFELFSLGNRLHVYFLWCWGVSLTQCPARSPQKLRHKEQEGERTSVVFVLLTVEGVSVDGTTTEPIGGGAELQMAWDDLQARRHVSWR